MPDSMYNKKNNPNQNFANSSYKHKENICYSCNGKGYHMEESYVVIGHDYDGSDIEVEDSYSVPCEACNGTGKKILL